MSFGNKGGGCKTGRKYPEQITVGLTEEHFEFLRQCSRISLADALRQCVEKCMLEGKLVNDRNSDVRQVTSDVHVV